MWISGGFCVEMILLLLLCCLPLSWAEHQVRLVEPPLRVEMPPPPPGTEESSRNVFQSWMPMPIDHFDPQNSDTFLMRFMFNEEFFVQDGSPIFILVGGEWAIDPGWLRAGNMYEMARENGGYQIYTEHRYYGLTQPFAELTVENLRFLNVDQALADLAQFIGELKKIPRFAKSKVILYGGSYAANMVLWFKQRYPHLVTGGVASSGPIKGEVDFTGYLEVVYEAFLSEGGEQCIDHIKRGIDATIEALKTEEGREIIEDAFRLCKPRTFDFDDRFDLGYFSGLISWSFSSSVQTAFPGSLRTVCNNFANNAYGSTPIAQIGGYIASVQGLTATSCWALSYESYIASLSRLVPTVSRAWYYQTCLEYGYYQTAPRSGTPFDVLQWLSVEWYVDVCKRAFDERFDEQFVRNAVERTNTFFGGLEPNVNNTINIHGAIDPWKALGVLDRDLKDSSPTFYVPRASHCFDMRSWGITDTIQMTGVQQRARRLVASWLSDQTN